MKRLVSIVLILVATATVYAGPFGLEMGWSYEECVDAGLVIDPRNFYEGHAYNCSPPFLDPVFNFYHVSIDDNFGVYQISAAINGIDVHYNGLEVQQYYERLRYMLIEKYGSQNGVDLTTQEHPGREFSDGWIDRVMDGERQLYSFWNQKIGSGISEIRLEAIPDFDGKCKVRVIYKSVNFEKVMGKRLKELDEALYYAL